MTGQKGEACIKGGVKIGFVVAALVDCALCMFVRENNICVPTSTLLAENCRTRFCDKPPDAQGTCTKGMFCGAKPVTTPVMTGGAEGAA